MADHTFTVAGLIEHLKRFPLETPVYYRDMNFGGKSEPFTSLNVTLDKGYILVDSPHWYDCNEEC